MRVSKICVIFVPEIIKTIKLKNYYMESLTTIYTNGKSLFTLEDYGKIAGVCHVHGITIHSQKCKIMTRAMHEAGQLHYIFGSGDRKVLSGIHLNRKMNFDQFEIS